MKALQKRCASLWNVTEHCRILQNVTEALWGVAEHYGTLQSVVGCYKSVADRYRTYGIVTERNGTVMENTDFAHH